MKTLETEDLGEEFPAHFQKNKIAFVKLKKVFYLTPIKQKLRVRDKEQHKRNSLIYHFENKEIRNQRRRDYYLNNKEKEKQRTKEYHINNKEKKSEYYKEYNLKNRNKIKERKKEYYLKNREIILEKQKAYTIDKKGNKKMYTDNQILFRKKAVEFAKKGFCVNAAEKELIKLFIKNRKRLKEESIRNGLIMTYPQFYPHTYPQGD